MNKVSSTQLAALRATPLASSNSGASASIWRGSPKKGDGEIGEIGEIVEIELLNVEILRLIHC